MKSQNPIGSALVVLVAGAAVVATLGGGIFLLVLRETGPRAVATVSECTVTGSGRFRRVDCQGSWTIGGSLLEGGHIMVGTIQGAETTDVGKKLDVTVRGDTAYSRDLKLPLLLIAFGLVPVFAVLNVIRAKVRRPLG